MPQTIKPKAEARKRWGIPPLGVAEPDAESYELPIPPAGHFLEKQFAREVLKHARNALGRCSREAVIGQVRRANEILFGSPVPTREQRLSAETYIDVPAPAGSVEQMSDLILVAARASDLFGGPAVPWDANLPEDACRDWDISINWLFPATSEVVIANSRTADMWRVSYMIDGETVTFGTPMPAEIEITSKGKEALRRVRESGHSVAPRFVRIVESGRIARDPVIREAQEAGADSKEPTSGVSVQLISAGPGNAGHMNYYTPEFIDQTINDGMFAGAQCYYDHPTAIEETDHPERSVRKIAGYFSDPIKGTFTTEGLGSQPAALATFHAVTGNSEAAQLMDTAREFAATYPEKEFIGFSIYSYGVVDGTVEHEGAEWNRVVAMSECISVDLVTRAGARGGPIFSQESHRMPSTPKPQPARESAPANPWTDPNLQIDIRTKAEKEADTQKALTLQRDKILENKVVRAAVLSAAGVTAKEGDGTFSADELQKIDATLGLDPNGAISKTLADQLGGGSEDPADPKDDGTDGNEVDVEALDDTAIDAMTPDEKAATLKRIAKKAKSSNEGQTNVNESAAVKALQAKVEGLQTQIEGMNRGQAVESLIEKHKVPESHRGLFTRSLMGVKNPEDMAEAAADYSRAHLSPSHDGFMIGATRESSDGGSVPNFYSRAES